MFITLPIAFGQMAGGQIFGTLFFVVVTFAAVTSSISLLEPAVAWVGERLNTSRAKASLVVGGIAWAVGLGSAASFNIAKDVTLPNGWNFFDVMDQISNNVLLPVGGILIALFSSWLLNKTILDEQLSEDQTFFLSWLWLARIVAPLGVLMVFTVTIWNWL
jgi:NSS family neurotransmitter:Na+ symporter